MHKENTVILNFTSTSSIAAFSHSKSILDACAKRFEEPNSKIQENFQKSNFSNLMKKV